jgi:hypothetical protein
MRTALKAFAALLLLAAPGHAAPLSKPLSLAVSATAEARFVWQAVDGAAVYRVAVFDAADADGKRPLLAAVWVKGLHWDYAKGPVVAKVGKLPSTKPLPLPKGRQLRVMVAAARADGSDKSEWAGEDFKVEAGPRAAEPTPAPTPSFTATPLPVTGTAAVEEEAEIELEGGEEFKSSPEPAVLDVEDALGGASTGAAAGAVAVATAPDAAAKDGARDQSGTAAVATVEPTPATLESAAALLKAGKAEEAEAAYRQLLQKDGSSAAHWEGLGDALVARKMKAEALEAYNQALLLDGKRLHLRQWIRTNVPRR